MLLFLAWLLDIQTSAPTNWVQIITLIVVALTLFLVLWPLWRRP